MKKALILLMTILCLSTFVSAQIGYDSSNNKINLFIEKGWNLIPYITEQLDDSSILQMKDAKYIFLYDSGKYELIYKKGDNFRIDETSSWKLHSSVWAYFEEEGQITIDWGEHQKKLFSLNNQKIWSLNKGWNFIFSTPEMKQNQLSNFKGDCIINKYAGWQFQKWNLITPSVLSEYGYTMDTVIFGDSDSDIGRGTLINVADSCKFYSSSVTPPPIPN
jgi:hypothetical protein